MRDKKKIWINDEKDRIKLHGSESCGGMTSFGYKRVAEDEKRRLVLKHFDTVAGRYDFMNTLLSFGIHILWKRRAVKGLGLKAGDRVIDVCGGTGDLTLLAARAVSHRVQVILVDMNRAMIERGRPKVSRSPYGKNIRFIQGDAEDLSFREQSFDAVMVGFGVRNLTHMEAGFREMYRVLKPGGKLICLEFSKPLAPLFRELYDFYSFHIMPLIGWLIVGSRRAYTYLPESIRLFPLPDELTGILKTIGFSPVTYCRMTKGIAVVHLAIKG